MKGVAILVVIFLQALDGGRANSASRQTFIVYGCGPVVALNLCGLVPETGEVRQLTSDGTARRPYLSPSLSPDGKLLAFSLDHTPYVASQNLDEKRRLGKVENVLFTSVRPDRQRVALGAIEGKCPPPPPGRFNDHCRQFSERATLKIVAPSGQRVRKIPGILSADWAGHSLIAPIDHGLWLLSDRPSEAPRGIALFPRLGLSDVEVSPDRRFVALGVSSTGSDYVAVFSREVRRLRRLTAGPIDQSPAWSPDGKNIVFTRNHELYVVAADGRSKPQALGVRASGPTWGLRIAE